MARRTISELLRTRDEVGPIGALEFLIEAELQRTKRGRATVTETTSERERALQSEIEHLRRQLAQTEDELRYCRNKLGLD